MSQVLDQVTLRYPRSSLPDLLSLSASLTERMHELLERNTDAALTPVEQEELRTLVERAQFGQILMMALGAGTQS